MAVSVSGALPLVRFSDLPNGATFIQASGASRLFGMKGKLTDEWGAVIFGSTGTEYDDLGAAYVTADDFNEELVLAIDPLRFRVDDGNGYGVPAATAENGSIIVDFSGNYWFQVKVKASLVHVFNLQTGESGKPDRAARYNSWELMWDRPGHKTAEILHAQGVFAAKSTTG